MKPAMTLKQLDALRRQGKTVKQIVDIAVDEHHAPKPKVPRKPPESDGHCLKCATTEGRLRCILDGPEPQWICPKCEPQNLPPAA